MLEEVEEELEVRPHPRLTPTTLCEEDPEPPVRMHHRRPAGEALEDDAVDELLESESVCSTDEDVEF